jgi:hypothetical protein
MQPEKRYLAPAASRQAAQRAQARYAHMLIRRKQNHLWAVSVERMDWHEGLEQRTTFVIYLVRKDFRTDDPDTG